MRSLRLTAASRTAMLGTLACGVAAAAVPSASASATPETGTAVQTGQVVFSYGTSNGEGGVAVANADGSAMRAITITGSGLPLPWQMVDVKMAPDGTHLAFLDNHLTTLYVANADGSDSTALPVPAPGSSDSIFVDGYQWSPDGQWLYIHDQDDHTGVDYLGRIHPDGSGLQRLTPAPGGAQLSVADGSGDVGWGVGGGSYTIYSPATNITRTVPLQWFDLAPSLSPDGKYLAILQAGSGHATQIVVRPTDGSPEWVVQSNAATSSEGYVPQWSPNESQLAYWTAKGQTVGSSSGNDPAVALVPSGPSAFGGAVNVGSWISLPAGTPITPPTAGTPPVSTIPGTTGPKVYRDAGGDRVATGIAISQQKWTANGSAKAVVLATSLNFPDALSGGPLAAKKGGPLLLTDGSAAKLDPRVLTEIKRVLPNGGAVYVLGGDGAVKPTIVAQLKSLGYSITQFKGRDRADTALQVAVTGLGSPQHVVVATGTGFADALAAGPYAAGPFADAPGAPAAIVLSDGASLDPATAAFLHGKTVATVGAQAGKAWPHAAKTFPGVDRFDTAARVAREFTGPFADTQVGIANGIASATNPGYPDALTGGAYMAESNGPIVLVNGVSDMIPSETSGILASRTGNTRADIFGGTGIISPYLADSIVSLLHGIGQF